MGKGETGKKVDEMIQFKVEETLNKKRAA